MQSLIAKEQELKHQVNQLKKTLNQYETDYFKQHSKKPSLKTIKSSSISI